MIEVKKGLGQKIIELGCGENRHPQADCAVDIRPLPNIDFQVDFNKLPMPIGTDEWDGVIAMFVLEHLPFANVVPFLEDVKRILKPGAKAVFAVPNTEAQQEWIKAHPEGWDGKDLFTASSELLFGSQSYDENYHASAFTPIVAAQLFQKAGFTNVMTHPYNPRGTDLVIEALKPLSVNGQRKRVPIKCPQCGTWNESPSEDTGYKCYKCQFDWAASGSFLGIKPNVDITGPARIGPPYPGDSEFASPEKIVLTEEDRKEIQAVANYNHISGGKVAPFFTREELFDKVYFNGGQKFGGYKSDAFGAFRDFPCHEITFRHILLRKPESVLELGCARGYILKRIHDAGIHAVGYEISKHCYMTRVTDHVRLWDLCNTPWDWKGNQFDLCFSAATLEHIPEEFLPAVIGEMKRTCKRGLHGIDFGEHDDGFDKTHCTLKPKTWWQNQFNIHAPGWPVEIVDKEELERTPPDAGGNPFWDMSKYLNGDGKSKWNLGSFSTMMPHGWMNTDIHDLSAFAQGNGYRFQKVDLKQAIPVLTGTVDLLFLHCVIEHFTYAEALSVLRECRRAIHPNGAMRIVTPDAMVLIEKYSNHNLGLDYGDDLSQFDEINDGSANAPTPLKKLWELLMIGHSSIYDMQTLAVLLDEAGWIAKPASFHHTDVEQVKQILRECTEMPYGGMSLFCDAIPKLG